MKKVTPKVEKPVITDEMIESFASQVNKSEFTEGMSALFDLDKIESITDLTKDEIRLITRINMIADIKDLDIYKRATNLYMRLLLSKQRKSRGEILEMFKGLMSRMNNMLGIGGDPQKRGLFRGR
jgi:hypothetical protein